MVVSVIQLDIEWGSPMENIHRAEHLIKQSPNSDLYVLPEMWSTGFITEPEGFAEKEDESISLEWMRRAAREHRCAISGSLAIQTADGTYRNRHYFVNGKNDSVSYYDKHHLFKYGKEDRFYVAGEFPTIVEYEGFRLLLLTCYDLRFPAWSRYSETLDYDVIIYVACWPEKRQNSWQILTRARAMENQAYVIACNRIGNDKDNHYRGLSAIISPIGKTLAACGQNTADIASSELDLESLRQYRRKFRVLEDRDMR